MKLRQLRYVLAIADNGLNITAAADRLCTSQPGVSKQLKLLEEELGFEIFVRKGKTLTTITAPGREVVTRARLIVREADDIRHICRGLVEVERPERDPSASACAHRTWIRRHG